MSNPYRSTGSDSAVNPPGLWTTNEYDALGRVKKVTTPDGAAVTTAYSLNEVTVTDQTGASGVVCLTRWGGSHRSPKTRPPAA